MVPNRLEQWTLKDVDQLLARGVYESDLFELKEQLSPASDALGKHRLRKTCAGFANRGDGFLVIGVSDDRRKLLPPTWWA